MNIKTNQINSSNKIANFILMACLLCFISCKTKENNQTEEKKVTTDVSWLGDENSLLYTIKNMKKASSGMKSRALPILEHRYKETNRKAVIILDKDIWEYEFVFNGKKMSKPGQMAGSWVDFNEDLTYTYGYYEEVQGSGKYTFSIDTRLLLMVDDSDEIKPQEYIAKVYDQTMVLEGNAIYNDNNYNAKLARITTVPAKRTN